MSEKNKKNRTTFLLLMIAVFCLTFCSCQKKKQIDGTEERDPETAQFTLDEIREEAKNIKPDYPNIDFSNIEIIIPDVDEIEDLTLPIEVNIAESEEIYEKVKNNFYDNVKLLTGKDEVDEKYVNCRIWNEDDDKWFIPINDVTDEDLERITYYIDENGDRVDEYSGYMLNYNDLKNSMSLYGSSLMCEIAGERVLSTYEEPPTHNDVAYRPQGTTVKSFIIPSDSVEGVSYTVDGKPLALKDAIAYVEANIKKYYENYHYVCSPFLDYKVIEVEVRKLEENSYYYCMYLKAVYNGITLSYNKSLGGYYHEIAVMSENSFDYVWSCALNGDKKLDGEIHDKFISLKGAMNIASRELSQYANMPCISVELMYCNPGYNVDEIGGNTEIWLKPVYQFQFVGYPNSPDPIIEVDAVTGKVANYS